MLFHAATPVQKPCSRWRLLPRRESVKLPVVQPLASTTFACSCLAFHSLSECPTFPPAREVGDGRNPAPFLPVRKTQGMLEAPPLLARRHSRSAERAQTHTPPDLHFRTVRPSLLDLRFCGDAWIEPAEDGTFQLYLGDYCLAQVEASPIDLPALNRLFDAMRHRRPRLRGQGLRRRT